MAEIGVVKIGVVATLVSLFLFNSTAL